jgi:FkbM family methyltransferase
VAAPTEIPTRVIAHLRQRRHAREFRAGLTLTPREDLVPIGDLTYGGYVLPTSLLGTDSVCLFAGVGEDITFDLSVIARFGATVHSVDPVPRAATFIAEAAAHEPRLVFRPLALWSSDTTLTFHAPRQEGYVSQSAVNLHDTAPAFDAPARSVESLMKELGHDHVDLLKVSAEGAEYEIIDHVIAAKTDVRVVCVEYSQPSTPGRPAASVAALQRAGYRIVAATGPIWGFKLTLVGPGAA